ncbi:MAG: hypothetical protein Q9218_004740 [Villophora microphyllina]
MADQTEAQGTSRAGSSTTALRLKAELTGKRPFKEISVKLMNREHLSHEAQDDFLANQLKDIKTAKHC